MLLNAQNLACHRGSSLLVDSLDLMVMPGEAVWLTGPNGAGKSTLLRVLAGVQPPLRGSVTKPGAFIYQPSEVGFDAGLTLLDNLAWWTAVHKARAVPISEALAQWGLLQQLHRPFGSLSQGQKQRAALTRLSLSEAKLWLLDEPLAHLDHDGEELFKAAAVRHLQRGGALIAATHSAAILPQARMVSLGQANA